MKNMKSLGGGAKSLGFTLAEVLITLAVIGVVAALTIPTVVHKYQQKQMYAQFIKVYNTLSNAVNLSIAENGSPETWAFDMGNQFETTQKYILPFLKVVSECKSEDASQCLNYDVTILSGQESLPASDLFFDNDKSGGRSNDTPVVTLADGSTMSFHYGYGCGTSCEIGELNFYFDTNGKKGPNVIGRDVFQLLYLRPDSDSPKWVWYSEYTTGGEDDGSGGIATNNCDPSIPNEGFDCAGRLLLEGKMSY